MTPLSIHGSPKRGVNISCNSPKTKRDERTVQKFYLLEVCNLEELRYIDPFSKLPTSLTTPFENLFDKIH